MRKKIFSFILIAIGISQMLGFILGSGPLTYFGRATAASPYPHIFGVIGGIEYWSQDYLIKLKFKDGSTREITLNPKTFAKINGNHFIKMSFAISLSLSSFLKGYWKKIWRQGICEGGPLANFWEIKSGVEIIDITIFSNINKDKLEHTIRCSDG